MIRTDRPGRPIRTCQSRAVVDDGGHEIADEKGVAMQAFVIQVAVMALLLPMLVRAQVAVRIAVRQPALAPARGQPRR